MRTDGADTISPPRKRRDVLGPSQAVWQEAPRPPPRALVGALGQRVVQGGHEVQPADPGLRGNPGDKRPIPSTKEKGKIAASWERGHLLSRGRPEQQRPVPDPGLRRLFPPVRSRGGEGARERGRLSGVCVTRALVPSQDSSNADHLPGSRLLTPSRRPCELGLPHASLGTGDAVRPEHLHFGRSPRNLLANRVGFGS